MSADGTPPVDSTEWLAAWDVPEDQRYEVSQQRKQDWWERNVGNKGSNGDNDVVQVKTKTWITDEQKRKYEEQKKRWNYDEDGNIDYSKSEDLPVHYGEFPVDRSADDGLPQAGKRGGRYRIRYNKEGKPYRHYY